MEKRTMILKHTIVHSTEKNQTDRSTFLEYRYSPSRN